MGLTVSWFFLTSPTPLNDTEVSWVRQAQPLLFILASALLSIPSKTPKGLWFPVCCNVSQLEGDFVNPGTGQQHC